MALALTARDAADAGGGGHGAVVEFEPLPLVEADAEGDRLAPDLKGLCTRLVGQYFPGGAKKRKRNAGDWFAVLRKIDADAKPVLGEYDPHNMGPGGMAICAPTVTRPPFDKMFIMSAKGAPRGAGERELITVFDEDQAQFLEACGFERMRYKLYSAEHDLTRVFTPLPGRRPGARADAEPVLAAAKDDELTRASDMDADPTSLTALAIIRDAVVPLSPSERLANAPAALKLSPSVISFSSAKEICDVFEYPFSIEGKLYSPMVDWCATKKSLRRAQWLGDGVSAEDVKRNEDNFDNRKKAYCAIQLLDKYDPADATPKPRFSTDVGYDSKEVGPSGTKGGKETWSTWDKLTCELVEAARRRSGALPAEA